MDDSLLEVRNVHKNFGGLRAVDDLTFGVPKGRISALIGPNGSGKTTTFNLISGAIRRDSGSIRLAGHEIAGLRPDEVARRGVARTFQLTRAFERLTVLDNAVTAALRTQPDLKAARRNAMRRLEWVGLASLAGERAGTLPLVDRKRLELARAVASEPQLLLLDEVLAGLRPAEIDSMLATLRGLREEGMTLLIVEHIMRVVMRLSDWVYVLDHGRLIAQGTPRDVAADENVITAYLGKSGREAVAE